MYTLEHSFQIMPLGSEFIMINGNLLVEPIMFLEVFFSNIKH